VYLGPLLHPRRIAVVGTFTCVRAAVLITGQAIGIGGWDPYAIASVWSASVGRTPQTFGIPAPQEGPA
jgi:hypothetical protein